jgi:RNA polymerase sigma-70 factor (ECF subfamily)
MWTERRGSLTMSRFGSVLFGSTSGSLIVRVQKCEPDAWRKLAEIHTPLVYGWSRRSGLMDADAVDAVQEVFQSVYRHLTEFDGQNQRASFCAWLWTITRNQARLFHRRRGDTPQAIWGTDVVRKLDEYPDWIDDEQEPATSCELR